MESKKKKTLEDQPNRRQFLTVTATSIAGAAAATSLASQTAEAKSAKQKSKAKDRKRIKDAFNIRKLAALINRSTSLRAPTQMANGDEERYASQNFYASFTKTLPHNQYGEVDPAAFIAFQKAVATGRPADYDAIPLSPSASRRLANPQGALQFIMTGLDGHATRMRPAPTFRGAETAAEMVELYWLALTRDVPFLAYSSDAMVNDAVNDINQLSAIVGPTAGGQVNTDLLFRGSTPGDAIGPYISQFLWQNVPYGPSLIEQKYAVPVAGEDFMTSESEWLHIQRGGAPTRSITFDDKRYIYNNRALGEYVHTDVLFQAYFNAALIMLGYGGSALDQGNPYRSQITNQGAFTSLGGPWILDLVSKAGNLALQGAWYHKWNVHRRLRPEAYSGRVHFANVANRQYEINAELLNSQAVAETFSKTGNGFLPMAFAEGSPTHPAYPAGHATIAGACSTVLKACFDENFVIQNAVEANFDGTALNSYAGPDLTLGGEINKLANNISLGRDAAGVHYRSDGEDGLLVGEQQAIGMLQDASLTLNEDFGGFHLTKFDGTKIQIRKGKVRKV